MNDKFIRLNIAVKPSANVANTAIQMSHQLAQKADVYFELDGKNYYPHLTIYSPEFPESNLNDVFTALGEIADIQKTFTTTLAKVQAHSGYIDIEAELNEEFKLLHEMIVNQLNPLREGQLREKYTVEENLVDLSETQRLNINKYGYPDAMTLYRPHLTIIRLKDKGIAENLKSDIQWEINQLQVNKIAAFTMSSHGTCTKMIKEYNL